MSKIVCLAGTTDQKILDWQLKKMKRCGGLFNTETFGFSKVDQIPYPGLLVSFLIQRNGKLAFLGFGPRLDDWETVNPTKVLIQKVLKGMKKK